MPFTLVGPCEFREEIRKSRFITLAAPIASPADAQAFIEQHSDLNATHNCWAWKLDDQYRSNDDGEPGGTAGRPILAAIEAQEFDQVVVLVIRWYGGIQLGTGGLARAYGGGANKCLQQAERLPLIQRSSFDLACSFSELALVKVRLAELNGVLESEAFTANGVQMRIAIGLEHLGALQRQLADLSRGRILLQGVADA
ncbi:Thymidylate synthase [Pseudomonas syringae pv. cilantro]|uniref:Thymidylate synthase n=2 Tax=Pseudomonas syringae group TaxID=136849 RepID=A0A0N0GH90_PSESX|nr:MULTISPECIES: YigZ family protein [Pseudomonas syringae group]KPC35371.1 Thymidylate synthase [Pseudomonas syringae pv. cilantro]KPW81180.1 Thymidylate synthase [Pseudomonas syringae pv. coriandricola]RMN06683.1 Thymidylate synthase [Pseudomonas syringae pv. coriandricola]